jgi:hypothetical protein
MRWCRSLERIRWWAGGLFALLLCSGLPVAAALDEGEVKAAIVYNLLQFLEWPDAPSGGNVFVLCLRPASELVLPLQKLAGQPVRGAALEIRALGSGDARGCNVAYADGNEAERAALLRRLRADMSTFVIADRSPAMDDATAIQLRWVDNKIAFEVNMAAVRRSGAQVSSRILRLAKAVHE